MFVIAFSLVVKLSPLNLWNQIGEERNVAAAILAGSGGSGTLLDYRGDASLSRGIATFQACRAFKLFICKIGVSRSSCASDCRCYHRLEPAVHHYYRRRERHRRIRGRERNGRAVQQSECGGHRFQGHPLYRRHH